MTGERIKGGFRHIVPIQGHSSILCNMGDLGYRRRFGELIVGIICGLCALFVPDQVTSEVARAVGAKNQSE